MKEIDQVGGIKSDNVNIKRTLGERKNFMIWI